MNHRWYTPNIVERPIYRFLHLIFALGVVHLMVLAGLETMRYFQTSSEIRTAKERVNTLDQKVDQLRSDLDAAQTTAYRDAMVRKYGYVRKDEVLIRNSDIQ